MSPTGEFPWPIPADWAWARIGDITGVVGGGTPRTAEPRYWDGGEVPWITPADLSGYSAVRISEGRRNITEPGLQESSAQLLPVGTVLLSSRAPVGYVAVAANPLATNQGFKSFLPTPCLVAEYLYYFLLGNRVLIESFASGTTFQEISAANAAKIPVPIAPIAEQRRIVAAIEEHLSRLDAAVAAADLAHSMLPIYRAAVLNHAIETGIKSSEHWRAVPLRSLLKEPLRNGHSAKKAEHGRGIRTLTLTAVTAGDFGPHNTKLTTADPERVRDLWLKADDILVERSNTPELVGTARRYTGPSDWTIFPDLLIRVRVDEEKIVPRYAELVLQTESVRAYYRSRAQGIAGSMPKIDQGTVERTPIPLAPIHIQNAVVAEVERRLSVLMSTENAVVTCVEHARALRHSIFQRAFTGNLVPQDSTDERASVLLERIRAARQSSVRPRERARARA